MASFTDVYEVDVLKATTGQATSILTTTPLTPWVALTTTLPTDSAAGTEVSGGSYARVSGAGKFGTPSAGSVSNNAAITFPTATGDWGDIVGFEIYDAATAGNRIGWGTVTKTIQTDDTASFGIGTLTITLD